MSDTINRARQLATTMDVMNVVSFHAVKTILRDLCDELETALTRVVDLEELEVRVKKIEEATPKPIHKLRLTDDGRAA